MKAKNLYEKIENVCTFKNGNHKKDYWCVVRMLKGKKATHHYQCYRRGFLSEALCLYVLCVDIYGTDWAYCMTECRLPQAERECGAYK